MASERKCSSFPLVSRVPITARVAMGASKKIRRESQALGGTDREMNAWI